MTIPADRFEGDPPRVPRKFGPQTIIGRARAGGARLIRFLPAWDLNDRLRQFGVSVRRMRNRLSRMARRADRMLPNSLAFRLCMAACLWAIVVLPIAGYAIDQFYIADRNAWLRQQIDKHLLVMLTENQAAGLTEPVAPKHLGEALFDFTNSSYYWQITPLDPNANGPPLVSASLTTHRLTTRQESQARLKDVPHAMMVWQDTVGPDGLAIRFAELSLLIGPEGAKKPYSLLVAGPLNWAHAHIHEFRLRLGAAFLIAILLLLVMLLYQVRYVLRPLREMEQGIQAIRSGQQEQLKGDPPAEVMSLQHELNALIQSNHEIIERARTQVGNLAHALKTPLAVITNEADDASGAFAGKVAAQARIMRDQVNHYLDRARMAARAGTIGRVTEVTPVAGALKRALERIYRDKPVSVHVTLGDGLKFQGEKHDLEEMLGNLLDNACKWARGTVWLTGRSLPPEVPGAPPRLELVIEDDGPGLTEDQRAKLGKRGLRLDETKPGSGLGLSIVTDLATSYRGSFALEASRHGGLCAVLTLPAAVAER